MENSSLPPTHQPSSQTHQPSVASSPNQTGLPAWKWIAGVIFVGLLLILGGLWYLKYQSVPSDMPTTINIVTDKQPLEVQTGGVSPSPVVNDESTKLEEELSIIDLKEVEDGLENIDKEIEQL